MVRISMVLALAVVFQACAPAQPPDAETLISEATQALGAENLSRIEYSGSGWDSSVGQAWSVEETWPQFAVNDYNRVIDYEAGTSRQRAERQVLDPTKLGGGGAQPGAVPQAQESNIAADAGWEQKLPIWLTPYGFLRLAAIEEAGLETAAMNGTTYSVIQFQVQDGQTAHQMRGYFSPARLLERTETWLDNPVMGDMLVEVEFSEYEDFDGLLFPTHIAESRGGLDYMDLRVDTVIPNPTIQVPEQALATGGGRGAAGGRGGRGGGPADLEVSTPLGEGVWVVNGGYQSVVVEFEDYVAVIEGAQNAARSQAIIAEAKRLTGDKPVRYFITTHTHFDHISGIRDFVAEGATIIAPQMDVDFYERALNTPHTLNPDLAERVGATAMVQGVTNGFVLEDGSQRIELYKIEGSLHASDMMVAYLPNIRAVVEADMVQPWLGGAFGGGDGPHPFIVHVSGELDRLGLDYETIVPVHAPNPPPTVTREQLIEAATE